MSFLDAEKILSKAEAIDAIHNSLFKSEQDLAKKLYAHEKKFLESNSLDESTKNHIKSIVKSNLNLYLEQIEKISDTAMKVILSDAEFK